MKTLDEVVEIVENLNDQAHSDAWDLWVQADELMESDDESDWEAAEDIREEASQQQSGNFREHFWNLDQENQDQIVYWLKHDEDFKEQFMVYFGEDEFYDEFDMED